LPKTIGIKTEKKKAGAGQFDQTTETLSFDYYTK